MAEEERLTKAERRAKKRAERKRRQAASSDRDWQQLAKNAAITLGVLAGAAGVIWLAFFAGPESIDEAIVLSAAEVEEARAAAGCEIVNTQLEFERAHFEPNQAPPANTLYTTIRPTHGGPHFVQTHPLIVGGSDSQLDERATTHNLEHGSIIAWYDPEAVEGGAVGDMEAWSEALNDSGFSNSRAGGGIFVSPYTDPGISSGKAVALRAWGVAMDCDEWDRTVANSFVLQYFGTHSPIAPEGNLNPFPEELLQWEGEGLENAFVAQATEQASPPAEGESPADGASPAGEETAAEDGAATPDDGASPDEADSPAGDGG